MKTFITFFFITSFTLFATASETEFRLGVEACIATTAAVLGSVFALSGFDEILRYLWEL